MSNNLALHAHRVNLARRWSVQNEPDLVMVRCPGIPYNIYRSDEYIFATTTSVIAFLHILRAAHPRPPPLPLPLPLPFLPLLFRLFFTSF